MSNNDFKLYKLNKDLKNSTKIANNKKGNILNFVKNNLFIDEKPQMVSCLKSNDNINEYIVTLISKLLELSNEIIPVIISLK